MPIHINLRRNGLSCSVAGFRAFGWWGILKAPWNEPLYSERYGGVNFIQLGGGWRFKIRRIRDQSN